MSEFEEEWSAVMAEAERRARSAGRGDVVDYLALKSVNDLARRTAIQWLFDTFSLHAAAMNRSGSAIQIIRKEEHRFKTGSSTMVGTLVTFKFGIRSLMVEAGWPRMPQDGIVKGGGLARGHILHFGRKPLDHELVLVKSGNGAPRWIANGKTGERILLEEAIIRRHITDFLRE